MGYALRRRDDDRAAIHGLRDRLDRWVERIREALHMTYPGSRFGAELREIDRTGKLPKNWDGHGAEAVPQAARQQALWALQRIESKFGDQLPAPVVGAVPGGVVFVWRIKRREAEREVERELEMIFYEDGNEWAVTDRAGIEPTRSGEDVDVDLLLKVVDFYAVA